MVTEMGFVLPARCTSTPRRKTEPLSGTGSCHQRLAFHGPAERLGHGGVEVGDEAFDPLLKMLLGGEAAATEKLADQDRKPNLDLVDPRGMLGREVKDDPVIGIAQESLARRH